MQQANLYYRLYFEVNYASPEERPFIISISTQSQTFCNCCKKFIMVCDILNHLKTTNLREMIIFLFWPWHPMQNVIPINIFLLMYEVIVSTWLSYSYKIYPRFVSTLRIQFWSGTREIDKSQNVHIFLWPFFHVTHLLEADDSRTTAHRNVFYNTNGIIFVILR